MEQVTRIGLIHSGSKQNFVGPVAALVAALPSDVQVVERWADDDLESSPMPSKSWWKMPT